MNEKKPFRFTHFLNEKLWDERYHLHKFTQRLECIINRSLAYFEKLLFSQLTNQLEAERITEVISCCPKFASSQNNYHKQFPGYEFFSTVLDLVMIKFHISFDTILMAVVLEHLVSLGKINLVFSYYAKTFRESSVVNSHLFGGRVHTIGGEAGIFLKEATKDRKRFFVLNALVGLCQNSGLNQIGTLRRAV